MELLDKIKSVKLCLMAHPDNEKDSEFEDRISDLEDIEKALSKYNETLNFLNAFVDEYDLHTEEHKEFVGKAKKLIKEATEL